jgi:hypothetical protein
MFVYSSLLLSVVKLRSIIVCIHLDLIGDAHQVKFSHRKRINERANERMNERVNKRQRGRTRKKQNKRSISNSSSSKNMAPCLCLRSISIDRSSIERTPTNSNNDRSNLMIYSYCSCFLFELDLSSLDFLEHFVRYVQSCKNMSMRMTYH